MSIHHGCWLLVLLDLMTPAALYDLGQHYPHLRHHDCAVRAYQWPLHVQTVIDSLLFWGAVVKDIVFVDIGKRVTPHLNNVVFLVAPLLHEVNEEPRIDERFGGLYEVVDGFSSWY